ncbi:ubiquitin-like domain-containing protein [Streptomyces lycii]
MTGATRGTGAATGFGARPDGGRPAPDPGARPGNPRPATGFGPPAPGFAPPAPGFGPPADRFGHPAADGFGPADRFGHPADGFGAAPRLPDPPSRRTPAAPPTPYTHPPYDPSSARTEPQVPLPRQYPAAVQADTLAYTVAGLPLAPSAPAAPPGPERGGRAAARHAARRKRGMPGPADLRRLLPRALVLAFLAGGTCAFVSDDKEVRLRVDGEPRTLHTYADDVDELLDDEGLRLGPHDVVDPVPGGSLTHGDEITVRHGRPLALTLDGRSRRAWVTENTVEGVLRELGVRTDGAYLSLPPRTPVPRGGLALEVRTERAVTFLSDGRERTVRTNAATVREAVEAAGIVLRGLDTTSVDPESFPRDGQTVTVMRITGSRETREEPVPYRTVEREDPGLFRGTEVIDRYGKPGVKRVTYAVRTVNGVRQKPKAVRTETVREPVTHVVRTGTRPLPARVPGAEGLNWTAMARCESGGRPDAVDVSGRLGGLYQLSTGTWHRLGGTGRPQHASAAEQTYRAKKLYVRRGAAPWPECGRKLHE